MLINPPEVGKIQEALDKAGPLRHALETCYIEYLESKKISEVFHAVKTHRLNRCIEFCELSEQEKLEKSLDILCFREMQKELKENIHTDIFPKLLKKYPW